MGNVKIWIASLVILVGMVGCVPTNEEIVDLHNNVDILNEKIDEQQLKLGKEIDRVQDHVVLVNDAMKTVDGLQEKVSVGIEASRPFNPYADEMTIALGLIAAVTGFAHSKKSKKYSAIKSGVNKTLVTAGTTGSISASALYNNIGAARRDKGVN